MTASNGGHNSWFQSSMRFWRAWLLFLPLIVGLALAITGLEYARTNLLVKLEEAALGTETQMVYESEKGQRVLCLDALENRLCEESFEKAGLPTTVLWLGNSQLPAINRYKVGDATAPALLHDLLAQRGSYVVTLAQPNANLAEHGLIFAALAPRYQPQVLLLPVVLDDIREQGIRPHVAGFIDDFIAQDAVESSPIWPYIETILTVGSVSRQVALVEQTLHQRFEASFNEQLGTWWPLWSERKQLRGVFSLAMHTVRNKVLGISAQTKRKVDPEVYIEKMRILEAILRHARDLGIRVLLYVPPYRQDITGPYHDSDYNRLKMDIALMAERNEAYFANLEDIVPGSEWGTVVDAIFGLEDYDFMHFTGDGHKRLAAALDIELRRMGL